MINEKERIAAPTATLKESSLRNENPIFILATTETVVNCSVPLSVYLYILSEEWGKE